jgi:hypothetical protein
MSKGIKREGDCWHGSMSWTPKQTVTPAERASAARAFINSLEAEPAKVMRMVEDTPQKITYNGRKISGSKNPDY